MLSKPGQETRLKWSSRQSKGGVVLRCACFSDASYNLLDNYGQWFDCLRMCIEELSSLKLYKIGCDDCVIRCLG